MAIEWTEAFATGVASVDQQHRQLIQVINNLVAHLESGSTDPVRLNEVLEAVSQYACSHFEHEEQCMEERRCPAAAANKAAHAAFVRALAEIFGRVHSEGPSPQLAADLEEYLRQWLVSHIIGVDTKLRGCVRRVA